MSGEWQSKGKGTSNGRVHSLVTSYLFGQPKEVDSRFSGTRVLCSTVNAREWKVIGRELLLDRIWNRTKSQFY